MANYVSKINKDNDDYPIYDDRIAALATAGNKDKVIGITDADTLGVIDVDAKINTAIGNAISASY